MGRFLTGVSRLQQTDRKRVWKLLDNEVYLDDDNSIYLAPRNFYTDNYTIPMWVAILAGSPVDWDVRASHIHDTGCDCHSVIKVNLTKDELLNKGLLFYNEKAEMWVCKNIPQEYLDEKPVSKKTINDIFYRCMKAVGIPLINRCIIRAGVSFNFMFYVDDWLGHVFNLDLNRIYEEEYWDENVWY